VVVVMIIDVVVEQGWPLHIFLFLEQKLKYNLKDNLIHLNGHFHTNLP